MAAAEPTKEANVPYKITKGGLLQAITTAEELSVEPPLVINGAQNTPVELLPLRNRKRNIVFALVQNTGTKDVFITFDSTPPDADNHHALLAPYQQLDISKNRGQIMGNSVDGAWRVCVTQGYRAADM